jgi:hypothetical protein
LSIDERDTSNNNILQENGRDYKSIDGKSQHENSTDTSQESITETIDDLGEPERLISTTASSGEEELSTKLLLTTSISTKLNRQANLNHFITSTPKAASTTAPTSTVSSFTTKVPLFKSMNHTTTNLYAHNWRMRHYTDLQYSPSSAYHSTDYYSSPMPTSMIMMRDKWRNKSGCFYSCIQNSKGLQTVVSKFDYTSNIRLCEPSNVVSQLIYSCKNYN